MQGAKHNEQRAGIYIHVPFCLTKCPYCAFYSELMSRQMIGFVKAVQVEAANRAYELEGMKVQSIYFGGGTPSLMSHIDTRQILDAIRDHYDILPDAEVTLECNPGDVSQKELGLHMKNGVNRFSLGAQSFQPDLLKRLGRRHTAEDTYRMYGYFRALGADNISIDLMHGIPGETLEQLEDDLARLIDLAPEHISAYHLTYEPGTPFDEQRLSGELQEVDEETSLQMGARVRERLRTAGYEHYEILSFAKEKKHSVHNSGYWQGLPYVGLGPSAHSYIHPWRSSNEPSIQRYNDQLFNGAHFLTRSYEYITSEMQYEEYVMTRLRPRTGLSYAEMRALGRLPKEEIVRQFIKDGLLVKEGERLRLTERGIEISDWIMVELATHFDMINN